MSTGRPNTLGVIKAATPSLATGLTVPETLSLEMVPASKRASVLDIGIGAGRTTGPLLTMFDKYVGVDIADEAVDVARKLYPSEDLSVMDARDLRFAPESFDCVLFSFNGIDCVDFAGRETVLRQVQRVLRPGGFFIYSTHNLGYRRAGAWQRNLLVEELIALRPKNLVPRVRNRLKLFRHQSYDDQQSVAYINDPALSFALLLAYVDIPREVERLRDFGLVKVETIGNTQTSPGYGDRDCWVYIVARKQ